MKEMTYRKRILETLNGKQVDKIPFFHHWRRLQTGQAERVARNQCMGVWWQRPCYEQSMPNVEVVERISPSMGPETILREYHTPVGTLTELVKQEPGVGKWKAQRSWRDVTPWILERRIQKPEDYDVLKFIIQDLEFKAEYFPIKQAKEWLAEDGVVVASLPHSPMQMLMIDWIGTPTFFIHLAKYREKVEELYHILDKRYEDIYRIAANSPADAVMFGDNLDGVLVNPSLFRKYFMPSYEKCARALHGRGKLFISHFDGRLNTLKELIAQCPQDIIEGFHPPPMGDLKVSEALNLWEDKVILVGFPGSIYTFSIKEISKYLIDLLKSVIPGYKVGIEASTENLVSDEHLLVLSNILEKATLPLSDEKIDELRRIVNSR